MVASAAMAKTEVELEREARALASSGHQDDAIRLLGALINFTAHDTEPLPCLCRRCFRVEQASAETGGMRFVREFAVARGRVLYFWMPEEMQARSGEIADAVRRRLVQRVSIKSAGRAWRQPWTR
jgi:hypothetical protein